MSRSKNKKIEKRNTGYPFKIQNKIFGGFFRPTPLKINMEPQNYPIEKKFIIKKPPWFWVQMLISSGLCPFKDLKKLHFSAYNGTYVRPKVQQQHPPRHGKLLRFVARPWDLPPFQGDPLGLDGWMVGRWLEFGVEFWLLVGICWCGYWRSFVTQNVWRFLFGRGMWARVRFARFQVLKAKWFSLTFQA